MDVRNGVLQPLPYQSELRNYLKTSESELWKWFSSSQAQLNYTETLRLELLKSTYRLDPGSHPELYRVSDEVRERLGLEIPVTFYQSQHSATPNAALYYIPGEGHIVLCGQVLSLLSAEELKSMIGHELAHYVLWQLEGGEFLIVDRLLQTIVQDGRAAPAHAQSARWFQLYTEIYADRGSFCATGDLLPVIAGLVKLETGLQQVSAASYLKQANEIFETSDVSTEQLTHPETFIRARSLAFWADNHPDTPAEIASMVQGRCGLDDLDLLGQVRLTATTRQILEQFLAPKWFRTEIVLGHARMFFDDFKPASRLEPIGIDGFTLKDRRLHEYFCYVLLDFVAIDPELDEMPLAAAFEMSRKLDVESDFERLAAKELKIKAKDLARLKKEAEANS